MTIDELLERIEAGCEHARDEGREPALARVGEDAYRALCDSRHVAEFTASVARVMPEILTYDVPIHADSALDTAIIVEATDGTPYPVTGAVTPLLEVAAPAKKPPRKRKPRQR